MIVETKSSFFLAMAKSQAKAEALGRYGGDHNIECFTLNEKEYKTWLEQLPQ
jgi:phage FluMu gp28-like protein